MKKFAIFASALALAFAFTSCEKDKGGNDFENITEDGFYVIGKAAGTETIQTKYMMTAGLNEVNGKLRNGMFEKYVALKGGEDFTLALYEAGKLTNYTAKLTKFDAAGVDDQPEQPFLRGNLIIDGKEAMQVKEDGLYHIVLDLNKAKDLENPQIVVAKANWGLRGTINGWSKKDFMTAGKFDFNTITYKKENVTVATPGEFKFAYGGGWKIQLDLAKKVKANTNLGNDTKSDGEPLMADKLVPNGKNIQIKRGIYTIELTWKLSDGAINKSYTAKFTKTGMPDPIDYTNCKMELVGGGVADQEGAAKDGSSWGWGNVMIAANGGKPTVSGTDYTWTWKNVKLLEDGFKVRTVNAADQGKVKAFDRGGKFVDTEKSVKLLDTNNIKVAAGNYDITYINKANLGEESIIIKVAAK